MKGAKLALISRLFMAGACALIASAAAQAQPADLPIPAATTSEYPAGVRVVKTKSGPVYVDARGLTLYGMDMRVLVRWSPDPAMYCKGACADQWEPLLAPAGAKPNIRYQQGFGGPQAPQPAGFVQNQRAPDWTVIQGPNGPQWVYKGWHVVYTRKGSKPGSTEFEGADKKTWNTLKFIPPVPQLVAPINVGTIFTGGAYALADKDGKVLFTGACNKGCTWHPLTGGYASRGMGEWTVAATAASPQWKYRGQPVFVSQEDDPATAPRGGKILRP